MWVEWFVHSFKVLITSLFFFCWIQIEGHNMYITVLHNRWNIYNSFLRGASDHSLQPKHGNTTQSMHCIHAKQPSCICISPPCTEHSLMNNARAPAVNQTPSLHVICMVMRPGRQSALRAAQCTQRTHLDEQTQNQVVKVLGVCDWGVSSNEGPVWKLQLGYKGVVWAWLGSVRGWNWVKTRETCERSCLPLNKEED